jgi:hypothetical protein
MKLLLNLIKVNPNGIEEIAIEDVAGFHVHDNGMWVAYNDGKEEEIPFRANDGEKIHEWSGFSVFATRVSLKVDMTK